MPKPTYTVIRDTREQKGWTFPAGDVGGRCLGTEIRTVKTGDYTLLGYEDYFVIERKATTNEITMNLVQDRFERELERMRGIPMPVILMEFSFADLIKWPKYAGLTVAQMAKVRLTGKAAVKRMFELQIKYPYVHWLFAGGFGRDAAISLFHRVVEKE